MVKPVIHILIGPPGSGKSTWRAKYLANAVRASTVVSSDDLIDEFAEQHGVTYSKAFHMVNMKDIVRRVNMQLSDAIREGQDIIVDRTNMTAGGRRKVLSQTGNRYKKVAVVFNVPRDELNRRLDARRIATGKGIPAHVVDDMLASFVAPEIGEFDEIIYA